MSLAIFELEIGKLYVLNNNHNFLARRVDPLFFNHIDTEEGEEPLLECEFDYLFSTSKNDKFFKKYRNRIALIIYDRGLDNDLYPFCIEVYNYNKKWDTDWDDRYEEYHEPN